MAIVDEGLERKQILFNLLKSKDRSIVLLCFNAVRDEYKTINEISSMTGIDYSNVAGALLGNGKRYKTERALVYMSLVARIEINGGATCYYKISDKGVEYAHILEKQLHVTPVLDPVTGKFRLQKR